ncbi:V-type ATP synthase subunit E [Methanospirillum sp. J.3.6.1-F.2.7.3]|jgi:V/A-type H+-transporting ATPase subunit E|uniref:A-type ATP synthase subunit E n=2 Tax=Methanospirillum TaxID=2202 RepID=A0A8E7AZU1_9EURY|nr:MULTISPECIES: V-type ATP synthase subunit E family protein [Methanospirillum]MDX8550170.1 V-type ATP synthase subunit E family protein [Methanospirillum hungatei]QVV90440.1 V-type ATP synthase subunit E [Methanospirillum sp. J.3.6.1-F.2.7.3]QXO94825.1 V-type ATP synthase subunit E [Methanospirillum hungatei]
MGLDAVIAEIKEKGRNEADTIVNEGSARKDEIMNAARQEVEKIQLTVKDEVEKNLSHIISQEEAAAHLIVKRQVLNAQKDLMDQVYKQALDKITAMPESFHEEAITSLLKKAKEEIPKGKVSCAVRDEKILKKVLKESEFSAYTFGSVIETDGGIIVESDDGQLQVDYSYRTFLNQVWESGLKDASDSLFA